MIEAEAGGDGVTDSSGLEEESIETGLGVGDGEINVFVKERSN